MRPAAEGGGQLSLTTRNFGRSRCHEDAGCSSRIIATRLRRMAQERPDLLRDLDKAGSKGGRVSWGMQGSGPSTPTLVITAHGDRRSPRRPGELVARPHPALAVANAAAVQDGSHHHVWIYPEPP